MANLALTVPQKYLMPSMPERTRSVYQKDGEFERAIRVSRQDDLALVVRHETVSSSTVSPPE
jgi:hypothetical protein